jgi:plasmid stability protein
MAQFVVRQLEDDLKERLKRRAERHGRSMEAEVREILRTAAAEPDAPSSRLGSRIAARFRGLGLPTELPAMRGQSPKPLNFEK